jgi:hypothetical protein
MPGILALQIRRAAELKNKAITIALLVIIMIAFFVPQAAYATKLTDRRELPAAGRAADTPVETEPETTGIILDMDETEPDETVPEETTTEATSPEKTTPEAAAPGVTGFIIDTKETASDETMLVETEGLLDSDKTVPDKTEDILDTEATVLEEAATILNTEEIVSNETGISGFAERAPDFMEMLDMFNMFGMAGADTGVSEARPGNPFTPDGQASVVDRAADGDGKEFYTFTTPAGSIFYLVIDNTRTDNNVYFLNAVTESDLVALAEKAGEPISASDIETPAMAQNQPSAKNEPDGTGQPPPGNNEPPAESNGDGSGIGSNSTVIFIVVAALIAGGAGFYFKIVRPKQQGANGGDDEDEDDQEDDEDMPFDDEKEETDGFSGDGLGGDGSLKESEEDE